MSCGAASAACQARIASPQALTRHVGPPKLEQIGLACWRTSTRFGAVGGGPAPAGVVVGGQRQRQISLDRRRRPDRGCWRMRSSAVRPVERRRPVVAADRLGERASVQVGRAQIEQQPPASVAAAACRGQPGHDDACSRAMATIGAPTCGRRHQEAAGCADGSDRSQAGVGLGRGGRTGHRRGQQPEPTERQHAAQRRSASRSRSGRSSASPAPRPKPASRPAIVQRSARSGVRQPTQSVASPSPTSPASPKMPYSSSPCR